MDNSTMSAEYGQSSGAIVNVATRSGSNQFHIETFEFLRNHAFNAWNFFNLASRFPVLDTLMSPTLHGGWRTELIQTS